MQLFPPREPSSEDPYLKVSTEDLMTGLNQSLPYSAEAEKGVLSCILQDPMDRLPEVSSLIPAHAFYHVAHRLIYQLLLEFYERLIPLDIATLIHALREKGNLDKVGGAAAISELYTFIAVEAHYPFYLKILTDKMRLRMFIRACAVNIHHAYNHGKEHIDEDIDSTIDDGEVRVRAVRNGSGSVEFKTTADWMTVMADDIDAQVTRNKEMTLQGEVAIAGVSTGIPALDERTNGFCQGHLWLVQAAHSDGKTAFAIQEEMELAHSADPVPCVHYLMEGSPKDFWKRCLSHRTRIDLNRILSGDLSAEEIDLLSGTMKLLQQAPFHLRHKPGMTKREILADMRLMHRKYAKTGTSGPEMLFTIDYLQRVKGRDKFQEEHEHIKATSAEITDLTGTLKSCTILLAQLAEDGKTAGSKSVACDADVTLTISCPPAFDEHNQPCVKKNRFGDTIVTRKDETRRVLTFGKNRVGKRGGQPITVQFKGEIQRFS